MWWRLPTTHGKPVESTVVQVWYVTPRYTKSKAHGLASSVTCQVSQATPFSQSAGDEHGVHCVLEYEEHDLLAYCKSAQDLQVRH